MSEIISEIIDDVSYALRALRRDPLVALTAAATLALCIGANTTVFSLVDSILIRPLPYPGSDRIYWVTEHIGPTESLSIAADYYSLREQNKVFEDVSAYDTMTLNWTGIDKPEQLDAAQVSASFFRVMGTQPALGRYLAPEEEGPSAPPVVVLSYAFWRNSLGADPNIVGKSITLDRLSTTIVGVMPQGFDYPKGTAIWKPWPSDRGSQRVRSTTSPMRIVNILARRNPGISETAFGTEMNRLTSAIRAEFPKEFEGFLKSMAITAVPLQQLLTGDLRPALLVLSGAVGLILLIACVNVANLLLARATTRQRELAIRVALGSSRGRILRQMLTESLVLALPGGAAGIMIAVVAVDVLNATKTAVLLHYPAISLDLRVLAFTFALTLLTGLVFGMAPAIAAMQVHVQETLKATVQTQSIGRGSARFRRLLVAAELAISLVLLIGAGLLARSFLNLAKTDLGFPSDNLLTLRVRLVPAQYTTAQSQTRFWDDVTERLKRLPTVRDVALSGNIPLSTDFYGGLGFQVAGRPSLPMAQWPQTKATFVGSDYFRTLGIPLISGRVFDSRTARDEIVVNEAFARKIFPGEDPVGRSIVSNPDIRWTIVGVVGNARAAELGAEPPPMVYRCACQGGPLMALLIRTNGDPQAAIPDVEAQVYSVDRNQPVFDVKTMNQRLEAALSPQRFELLLIGIFAALAIVMAAAGVFGVMSYLVTRRTREIGIRMAMGARPGDVLRLVMGESCVLIGLGIVAGLAGAAALTRYAQSLLYGVEPLDRATFALTPVILAAAVLAATLGPALRASRVDPTKALRDE
jgi:predicted permease